MCIKTCLDKQDCLNIAIEGIQLVLHQLTFWNNLSAVFQGKEATTGHYVVQFYLAVLDFLRFSRKYLRSNSLSEFCGLDLRQLY